MTHSLKYTRQMNCTVVSTRLFNILSKKKEADLLFVITAATENTFCD